jgi:hypothetical protein
MKISSLTLLFVLLLVSPVRAAGVLGHWEGGIQSPLGPVAIEIDLSSDANGGLFGTMSIPAQKLRGLRLSNFSVKDGLNAEGTELAAILFT